jgi:hypothetical protein
MRPVSPVAQRRIKRAAELGFAGTIAAPRHDRFLQAPQDQVAERVLPVFLADIRQVAAAVDDIEGFARDLEARGRASATVTRQLCTIAGFYRYAGIRFRG